MNIGEAVAALREGKKVRRVSSIFQDGYQMKTHGSNQYIETARGWDFEPTADDLLADDWEVVP